MVHDIPDNAPVSGLSKKQLIFLRNQFIRNRDPRRIHDLEQQKVNPASEGERRYLEMCNKL
ncbi:hypothetical protein KC872_04680 [Candidatus Kaiserbacteria bacterium]|nr:hypothetical protein [Candidatus Kaiserbacteria bacterium]